MYWPHDQAIYIHRNTYISTYLTFLIKWIFFFSLIFMLKQRANLCKRISTPMCLLSAHLYMQTVAFVCGVHVVHMINIWNATHCRLLLQRTLPHMNFILIKYVLKKSTRYSVELLQWDSAVCNWFYKWLDVCAVQLHFCQRNSFGFWSIQKLTLSSIYQIV